jgi:hypothetical protein
MVIQGPMRDQALSAIRFSARTGAARALKPVSAFLVALATIAMSLALVAGVQARLGGAAALDPGGEWLVTHRVQWGPYKDWIFRYRIGLRFEDGQLRGTGETVSVNGRPPREGERTTLQIVDGLWNRGCLIAWAFERNGARAGRGALRWRVADGGRLVGTFTTTFHRGSSVAQRADVGGPGAAAAPAAGAAVPR